MNFEPTTETVPDVGLVPFYGSLFLEARVRKATFIDRE
jgi:hypothetical protein